MNHFEIDIGSRGTLPPAINLMDCEGKALQSALNTSKVLFPWPVSFWPYMTHGLPDMPGGKLAVGDLAEAKIVYVPDMNNLQTIFDFLG